MTISPNHRVGRGAASTDSADARELYESIAALYLDPSPASYTRVFRMVAIARTAMSIQQITDYDTHLLSAQQALDAIFDRWEATDHLLVYAIDKVMLRATGPHIGEALERASSRALAIARQRIDAELAVQTPENRGRPLQEKNT